jgi:hypothetical protein
MNLACEFVSGSAVPGRSCRSAHDPAPERGEITLLGLEIAIVLLRHKFIRSRRAAEARQQGHRGKRLTSASMMRRRTVAIEFGTWRSGRNGGSSGSVTVGYGKLREPRGGTRS